ncbi:saccharopine dehydrogenase NADP-binding domain-containing protein [Pseudokordiimonas caeni]|uniref:saccharopine dehydrogenase NADP-binding domain-containing protein n=1 Tax=Pseudokordiimonas caeni TaxID=2997908 RepID=UPI0028115E63|nr:saccharopine dehydrogenase NADP-binding domain-containing protein [Pseudokordiimonas caeni]
MNDWPRHGHISGPLVIVGFGSIAQGVLPLILRHFLLDRDNVTIVTADDRGADIARADGIRHMIEPIDPDNMRAVLAPLFNRPGGFLVNVSVNVSSTALVHGGLLADMPHFGGVRLTGRSLTDQLEMPLIAVNG